jgi:hypothetical protein
MRTSVSRQCPSMRPLPVHLSLTPEPPEIASRPSTTSTRRWLRLLWRPIEIQRPSGRNVATRQPASFSRCTYSRGIDSVPNPSSRMWVSTPARHRAASASAISRAGAPSA